MVVCAAEMLFERADGSTCHAETYMDVRVRQPRPDFLLRSAGLTLVFQGHGSGAAKEIFFHPLLRRQLCPTMVDRNFVLAQCLLAYDQ